MKMKMILALLVVMGACQFAFAGERPFLKGTKSYVYPSAPNEKLSENNSYDPGPTYYCGSFNSGGMLGLPAYTEFEVLSELLDHSNVIAVHSSVYYEAMGYYDAVSKYASVWINGPDGWVYWDGYLN